MMAIQFLKFARMYRKATVMNVSPNDVRYFLMRAVPAVLGKAKLIDGDTEEEVREAAGEALEAFAQGLKDGSIVIYDPNESTQ